MIKLKDKYYIKIVPQRGDTVHRFEVTRRRIVAAGGACAFVLSVAIALAGLQVSRAHAEMANLRDQTAHESDVVRRFDQQTEQLRAELQDVQRQNQEIVQVMGLRVPGVPQARARDRHARTVSMTPRRDRFAVVQARLDDLAADSAAAQTQAERIARIAMRVLDLRRIASLAQARAIAAIPSIDPVDGAPVDGCFCYRTYPDAEFHEGVDLAADYGQTVRATAAGTVVFAGWDGSYGEKIVIDHGNGYQTWYAHLERIDVTQGQHVFKSEAIALVGATGFATGPHLHYQVMLDGRPIDPAPYLHGVPANVLASLP